MPGNHVDIEIFIKVKHEKNTIICHIVTYDCNDRRDHYD